MDNFQRTIFWSFIGYVTIWLYLLWPVSYDLINPFVFSNQKLSPQACVDYASWRIFVCLLFMELWLLAKEFKPEYQNHMFVFILLWIFFLVNFFLNYNDPYLYLKGMNFTRTNPGGYFIPLSYELIMGIVMFLVTIKVIRNGR